MPTFTYLSEHRVQQLRSVPEDPEIDELLQEMRALSGEDWLLEIAEIEEHESTRRWWFGPRRSHARKLYTLYADCSGEWQVMNLCVEDGDGSVFRGGDRSSVINFMLGYSNGIRKSWRELPIPSRSEIARIIEVEVGPDMGAKGDLCGVADAARKIHERLFPFRDD